MSRERKPSIFSRNMIQKSGNYKAGRKDLELNIQSTQLTNDYFSLAHLGHAHYHCNGQNSDQGFRYDSNT